MRRLKKGVSAVVVMSFVLFFAGLSFVYGANQIKGGISGMSESDIAGATVKLVGKPSISTTSTLDIDASSTFYLTLPTNSIFSLKVEKTGHITSYSTPTILNSDIGGGGTGRMQIFLPSASDWTTVGIARQSGKGQLVVVPVNNTTDPGRNLSGIMTAIVKNLSGASLVSRDNTRYINDDGSGNITLTQTAIPNTIGFVVCNLTPGTVITSAGMSGKTLNYRQTIIYPDSITSCISLYDGIIESTLGNFTGSFADENGTPVPSVTTNLIGVQSTTSNGSGNFTLSNLPNNNIPKATTSAYLKATKTGYKDTYYLDILRAGHDLGEKTLLSTSAFNQFASQAGVAVDSSKGCIAGIIKDSVGDPISGASGKIYNPDGTENGARVYYFDSSMNIDPSLTFTSSEGVFVAFNINLSTPLILTAQKGTQEFPYILDRTFANGLTMTEIKSFSETQGYSISGNVSISGGTSSVTDVLLTLTVSGGGSTSTRNPDSSGDYSFSGLTSATYTLTPSLSNYTFSPGSLTYNNLPGNQTGQNFAGTYAPPANLASISGTISYSGTETGTIGIGLFTTSDFSGAPAYGTTIASPGSYSISNIAPGTYYIASYRDTNSNGSWDSTLDPSGVYISNPITLSNNQNATGINITLTDPVAATLTIITTSLSGGTVGTAYNKTVSATGGVAHYTWSISSGSLPAGLAINEDTGAISGTPTTTGTSSFTVMVTDSQSTTAIKELSIVVLSNLSDDNGDSGSIPVGPLAAGISVFLVWWKRRKQR